MPSHPPAIRNVPSRDRLLRAAKRLFAARGYEQTATSAIARDARTSESQLMRYFGGKIGLLEAIFEEAWIDLNQQIEDAIKKGVSAGGRVTLLAVFDTLDAALARDSELAILFLFEGRRLRGKHRVRDATGFVKFGDTVRRLVRRAQTANEISPSLDAQALASSIIGAAEGMIRDRLIARLSGGRGISEREFHRTIDAMLGGFAHVETTRRERGKR